MLGKAYVCMYLANIVTTRPLYEYECQFAICESCFWCATIFHKQDLNSLTEEQRQKLVDLPSSRYLFQFSFFFFEV